KIPFKKSMRWGESTIVFGRPIHWLVALHGDQIVAMNFGGIEAGRTTRGHRFLAPEPFDLLSADQYVARLANAKVVVDPAERRNQMEALLGDHAARLSGT